LSKNFGKWYQKANKKEDTNKLTTLAFKMIPTLHNTLLATPKLKIYSGALNNFWSSPKLATTIFMGPNSNYALGEFVILGSLPNSNFTAGSFAHSWGPLGRFGFQSKKSNFTLGAFVLLGRFPNSNFTPGLVPTLGEVTHHPLQQTDQHLLRHTNAPTLSNKITAQELHRLP
jgi:hypothetical protein